MPLVVVSRSPEETEALAELLAGVLEAGDVLALSGEMGAGKTTFVRGLHRGLRCRGRTRSPSFTTLNVYAGELPLHHFDLFRYDAVGAAFLEEFETWMEGEAVIVIEWPERLGTCLPVLRFDVAMGFEGGTIREVSISAHGELPSRRLARWGSREEGGVR